MRVLLLQQLLLLTGIICGKGFTSPGVRRAILQQQPVLRRSSATASAASGLHMSAAGPFDALVSLVKAREACPPQVCLEQLLLDNVRRASLPEELFHWGHPAAMVLLTFPLALGGAYLGWQIKLGDAGADPAGVKRARSLHPPLMAAAGLLLVFGVQSGIASLLMQGQPLLDSTHAKTAGALLLLYGAQGFLGTSMGGNTTARLAHAAAGTALVALLLGHTALGLALGFQLL